MTIVKTDIDIDTKDRNILLDLIKHTSAGIVKDNIIKKHNTGVYVTDIPTDPLQAISSIDYNEAEDRGYFKLDILNVGIYEEVENASMRSVKMTRKDFKQFYRGKNGSRIY